MTTHRCIAEFDPSCDECVSHDETCGTACDRCGERMCSLFGPEPRACTTTCFDCSCSCESCLHARQDARDELINLLERESR